MEESWYIGDRTIKSRVQVTESQFADDLVLYVASQTAFESVGQRRQVILG